MTEQLAALASRLTDRDRAVVRLVGEYRVFTTAQLAKMFFNPQDRAEHRLPELTQPACSPGSGPPATAKAPRRGKR